METAPIRKLLHDLSNALNAAKINAYLLRRTHAENLDKDTMDGLDASLHDAERLISDFQKRLYTEISSNPAAPS